jgi:hypothetical protein
MALTDQQFQDFQEALQMSFDHPRLKQLLRSVIGKSLDTIAKPGDFRNIVSELIKDAEEAGYTMELLNAARQSQPSSERLLAFAQQFNLSAATAEQERIVRDKLDFIDISRWRARLGMVEVQVCRVETSTSFGTGFLVGPDMVLTNHHVVEDVLKAPNLASRVVCRFDYRRFADGQKLNPGTAFELHATDWLVDYSPYSAEDPEKLDYALLRLRDSPGNLPVNSKEPNGQPRGWFMVPTGPIVLSPGQPLHIVQHPEGSPLALALDTDGVIELRGSGTRVRYHTNTMPGSSGSPCCDAEWNLVALHHLGDPKYVGLSKKADWNQGVMIDAIFKSLQRKGNDKLLNRPQGDPAKPKKRKGTRLTRGIAKLIEHAIYDFDDIREAKGTTYDDGSVHYDTSYKIAGGRDPLITKDNKGELVYYCDLVQKDMSRARATTVFDEKLSSIKEAIPSSWIVLMVNSTIFEAASPDNVYDLLVYIDEAEDKRLRNVALSLSVFRDRA